MNLLNHLQNRWFFGCVFRAFNTPPLKKQKKGGVALKRLLIVLLYLCPLTLFADEVCPIGYTQTQYVTTEYVGLEYFVNDGFTQLEYIESDGTQWIDTGITPNDSTGVLLEASVPNASKENRLIGVKDSENFGFSIGTYSGKMSFSFGSVISQKSDWNISNNTKFTAKLNYLGDRKATVNTGSEYTISTLSSGLSESMVLFGQYNNGISTSISRIYNCKISDDESLVRDLIPAIRNKDNATGMYDNVTGMFYINDGSGDFIAGPEVQEINMGGKTTNLFDISKAEYSTPGYDEHTITISADGKLTAKNANGSSSARVYLSLSADELGLINGETYTIVVWSDNFSTKLESLIYTNGSYTKLLPPTTNSSITKTWVQANNSPVQVGNLYAGDYKAGATFSVWITLVKGSVAPYNYAPYGNSAVNVVTGGCVPCPPNTYKDFTGNSSCTPCPNGMLAPSGATSEAECMRILHIGDKFYPLNSTKKTSPALHIQDETGKIWYGNLYSEN